MNFSKYIILSSAGTEIPVIFSREVQHSSMVPKGMVPVSAGFCLFTGRNVIIPSIDSETLHLGPRVQDKAILAQQFIS